MSDELRTRYLLAVGFALTMESPSLGSVVGKKLRSRQGTGKGLASRFCDKCGVLGIPGETADFRVKQGKVDKGCRYCTKFR